MTDYNIRVLLAPIYDNIIRQDESEIKNLNMLPSSFFFIKKKETNGKLTGFTLKGGGYGHGIGMSQNAVKAMVDTGMDYKKIIAYFYEGTQLGAIYE
jgi:stage II sporulation protein D